MGVTSEQEKDPLKKVKNVPIPLTEKKLYDALRDLVSEVGKIPLAKQPNYAELVSALQQGRMVLRQYTNETGETK